MSEIERFDVLVLGSGQGGQLIAWHLAQAGRRTALVERRWIGGSCPNIACMPSKTEVWSARVAHLAQHGAQFGVATGSVTTDMATVLRRKRAMVSREVDLHLQNFDRHRIDCRGWALCGAEDGGDSSQRRWDARAGGRPGVSQHWHA